LKVRARRRVRRGSCSPRKQRRAVLLVIGGHSADAGALPRGVVAVDLRRCDVAVEEQICRQTDAAPAVLDALQTLALRASRDSGRWSLSIWVKTSVTDKAS
jgi:hypothetical protein